MNRGFQEVEQLFIFLLSYFYRTEMWIRQFQRKRYYKSPHRCAAGRGGPLPRASTGAADADQQRLTATAAGWFLGGPRCRPGRCLRCSSSANTRYDPRETPGGVCEPASMRHLSRATPDGAPLKSGDRLTLDA